MIAKSFPESLRIPRGYRGSMLPQVSELPLLKPTRKLQCTVENGKATTLL
jgi:hypothetical protein